MRKFIDKITPSFIRSYNAELLKNAPMGWQLQLPTITWVWLLVTVLTLPIPFLITLDRSGDDDILAVILISVLTAVLEGFLFVYILIQFNTTKTFGKRVFLNGMKEQLAYLYVFMLCMLHIIFYPIIVDYRKGNLMTAEDIRKEAAIYNQANFYFMGKSTAYRYFPSDATFLEYEKLEEFAQYRNNSYGKDDYASENNNVNSKETYYIEQVKPMMRSYFPDESEVLDSRYTRDVAGCPKLYMTEDNHLDETYYDYSSDYYSKLDTLYYEKYQLKQKSDAQRLKDIAAFIKLYNKYEEEYEQIQFESPDIILLNYKLNRFVENSYKVNADTYSAINENGYTEVADDRNEQLTPYRISSVHGNIAHSQHSKWKDLLMRLVVAFHVAVCLSVLLFIFKNIRLREFILTFVYTALLVLAVTIFTITLFNEEDFGIHVVILVFFLGIYFSFFDRNAPHYSSLKTVFVLLSNATFAYAPIFFYMYFHEYHDLGQLSDEYDYCAKNPAICDAHHAMEDMILYCSLWGGVAFYLFVGSTLYKRVYERLLALPLAK